MDAERSGAAPRRPDADSLINCADLRGGVLDTAAGKCAGLCFRHICKPRFQQQQQQQTTVRVLVLASSDGSGGVSRRVDWLHWLWWDGEENV